MKADFSQTASQVTKELEASDSSCRTATRCLVSRASHEATSGPVSTRICHATRLSASRAIRDWYRVQVPDGTSGFVSERLTQSTRQPLRTARASAKELLDRPIATAAPIFANLDSTLRLPVLGRFDEFLLVRIPDGREGWIVSTTEAS